MVPLTWKDVFRFWLVCGVGIVLAALVLVLSRDVAAGLEETLLFTPLAATIAAILALLARRLAPLIRRVTRPWPALLLHVCAGLASGLFAALVLQFFQAPWAGAFSFPPLLPFVSGALAAYLDFWLLARRTATPSARDRALHLAALVFWTVLAPLALNAALRVILQPEKLQTLVFAAGVGPGLGRDELDEYPGAAEAIRAAGLSGDMRLISAGAYGEGFERTVILYIGKTPEYDVQIPLKAAPTTVARVDGDLVEVWPPDAPNLPERFLIVQSSGADAGADRLQYFVDSKDGSRKGASVSLD